MAVSYLNAPFNEAHSSLPNTKRNTAMAIGFLFTFRPTPLPGSSLIRKSHIVPRPQGVGCVGGMSNSPWRA